MKERTRWTSMRISEAAKAGVKSRADLAGLSVTGYMEREYGSPAAVSLSGDPMAGLPADAVYKLTPRWPGIGVGSMSSHPTGLEPVPGVAAPEGAAPAPAPAAPAAMPPALAAFNDGFASTPPAGLEGHALTAPAVKVCGCGGRNGNPAPYRTASRLHQLACPFYSRVEG